MEPKLSIWKPNSADVMFLGAGFSRAVTSSAAPLMSDFFDRLDGREYWTLTKFLEESFGSPAQANVEEAMLRLDQIATAPFTEGIDPYLGQCRKRHTEVRRELDEYVIKRLCGLLPTCAWARSILFRCTDSATILTTNYDNLPERILSKRPGIRHGRGNTNCHHCRMCNILRDGCTCDMAEPNVSVRENWKGALIKLHGSVAWRNCRSEICAQHLCLTPHPHCKAFADDPCECCGGPCSPVLVLPSMHKRFDAFPELRRMWDAAYFALSEAKRVLFFGFSLPRSDAIIIEMLRCTIGRSNRIESIGVIDVNTEAVTDRLKQVLPNVDRISIVPFPASPNCSVPEWYNELYGVPVAAK